VRLLTRFLHWLTLLLTASALAALADPPARVGRVSLVSGETFFRAAADSEWTQATLNYPVTEHEHFATSADARLELSIGSAAVRLDEDSQISILRLDDDVIRVKLERGMAGVTVRAQDSRYPIEVLTSEATITLNGSGTYRIETGREANSTIITVIRGNAGIKTDEATLSVKEGREAVVTGAPLSYRVRDAGPSPFDDWAMARDQRYDRAASVGYISPEMTGYEELDENGNWQQTEEYGAIWVPQVTVVGWAPYRHGHWAWVAPWGWTWVDAAPWGFAPYHYGRWVNYRGAWGWAPGPVNVRPVYAPALVAWVGQPGWSFSFAAGNAPAVGWFPLGWGELYRPSYPCSVNYVRNINVANARISNIHNVNWSAPDPNNGNYSLRRFPQAVTVVPQQAFAGGRPVMRAAEPLRDNAPVARLPASTNAAPTVAPIGSTVANNAPQPPSPALRGANPSQRIRILPSPSALTPIQPTPRALGKPAAPTLQAVPAPTPPTLAVPVAPVTASSPADSGRRFTHTPGGRTVILAPGDRTQPGTTRAQARATYADPLSDALDEGRPAQRIMPPSQNARRTPMAEGQPHPAAGPRPSVPSPAPAGASATPPRLEHSAPPRVERSAPPLVQRQPPAVQSQADTAASAPQRMHAGAPAPARKPKGATGSA